MPRVFSGNTKYSKNKTSWNFGNPLPSIVRVQDTFMRSPQSCNNCTFTLGARVLMPMFNSTVFVGLKPTQRKNKCSHLIGDCFQQKMGRTGNFEDMASSTAQPAIPAIHLLFVEGIRHPSSSSSVPPFRRQSRLGDCLNRKRHPRNSNKNTANHG